MPVVLACVSLLLVLLPDLCRLQIMKTIMAAATTINPNTTPNTGPTQIGRPPLPVTVMEVGPGVGLEVLVELVDCNAYG